MPRASVPREIHAEVQKLIDEFNQENFSDDDLKELGVVGCSARFSRIWGTSYPKRSGVVGRERDENSDEINITRAARRD